MVWEWDRPSAWFVTLSCQSPISVRCAVALRPFVLWWPVTISHFSPNERFWPVCECDGCVCVCVRVCVRIYHCMDLLLWWLWCQWSQNQADLLHNVTRCYSTTEYTHTSRFLQWLAVLSHSARHCRSFNCKTHNITWLRLIVLTYSTSNIGTTQETIPLVLYSEWFSPVLNSGTQPNCKRIVNV